MLMMLMLACATNGALLVEEDPETDTDVDTDADTDTDTDVDTDADADSDTDPVDTDTDPGDTDTGSADTDTDVGDTDTGSDTDTDTGEAPWTCPGTVPLIDKVNATCSGDWWTVEWQLEGPAVKVQVAAWNESAGGTYDDLDVADTTPQCCDSTAGAAGEVAIAAIGKCTDVITWAVITNDGASVDCLWFDGNAASRSSGSGCSNVGASEPLDCAP
jgi:hypothetical protein